MNAAALSRAKAPFFHLAASADSPHDLTRAWERATPGLIARVIRGAKSTRKADFMDEIGAALQLPGFGENWDALNDSLGDGELFPGPLIVAFSDPALVLEAGSGMLQQLVQVLQSSAEFGASRKPARSRHFVICTTANAVPQVLKRWQAAGAEFAEPRRGRA